MRCLTFRPQAFRPQLFRPQIFEAGTVQRYTHSGPNFTGPSKLVGYPVKYASRVSKYEPALNSHDGEG